MNDSSKKPLFTDEELAGGDANADGETQPQAVSDDSTAEDGDKDQIESADESNDAGTSPELDEGKLQAIADQVASLDDPAMAAVVRGISDESRQALCAAIAGTLSDEQLEQCGLSKSTAMSTDTDDGGDDEAELQQNMAVARPENSTGGNYMSLTKTDPKAKTAHPHSKELAELKAGQLLDRAKAVHAKNPAVITADQLEGIEAALQGEKSMSLLEKDHGDLLPISNLVAMGERMVKGESNADLLKVKTLNMSLTGDDEDRTKPVKPITPAGSFDESEAQELAKERWAKQSTTPVMTG